MISPHKLFSKIALEQHGGVAVRLEERSLSKIPYGILQSNHFICTPGSSNGIDF
jgi:hypothetical protein